MDCNDNATETDDDPAGLVAMTTKKTWKDLSPTHSCHSSPKHWKDLKPASMSLTLASGASTSNEPIKSRSLPWNVDNKSLLPEDVDQQANVRGSEEDNSECSNAALLTWKDFSPTHHCRGHAIDAAEELDEKEAPSGDSTDSDKIVLAWSEKEPIDSIVNHGQRGQLMTWKQVSPTRLAKDPFGFSSPDSSDSDTVRHFSPHPQSSVRPMQESSSDASGASPTHGARSVGAGSDGSNYLPSPEDGFNNDYFYDEDFTVQFDTNLKDSLLDTAPSEGVSSASILEFSDTMTIEINEASSTLDGSLHPSQYESELSASEHNSAEMSMSDREMMCSSDMLQISDGPLFTPTPTNEGASHSISTDSLDKGARAALNCSTSTSEAGKINLDCGTKKELYMLSFFNHRGKQTTSMASVLSQASWSSEQAGSQPRSNSTSQDDMEGSNSSLQTHVAYGKGTASARHPNISRQGREPTRSRSSSSAMNLRHLNEATSSESMDGACSERQGRLTSWRNMKQRRKPGSSETAETAPRTKSMPELHKQTCLEKMMDQTRKTTQTDSMSTEGSTGDHHSRELRLSGESLMEIYQKTRSLSDHSLGSDVMSNGGHEGVAVQSISTASITESLDKSRRPPGFCVDSSDTNVQLWRNEHQQFDTSEKTFSHFSIPSTANLGPGAAEYQAHTIPRMYKRSLSSPARCTYGYNGFMEHSWTAREKETQYPPQFFAEPVALWKGTKNFSAQFPPNTRDCGIQTTTSEQKHNLEDKQMQTSPDKPGARFPCQIHSPQQICSPRLCSARTTTSSHQSRGVPRGRSMETVMDHTHCAIRPHSIGPISVGEEEEERRFPPYDAMVSRCLTRSERGSSLSPVRPVKQSFYSHRSLPDLSFLTSRSPISSPVHSPSSAPSTSFKQPVFFTPRVSGPCGSPNRNCHPKPSPHQYPCHPRAQQDWKHGGTLEGLNIEMACRSPRHARGSRSESGKRVTRLGPNHSAQSASSSSGFSTSTTSSGIDPGYHDSRHSPPMADQFPSAYQVWDNRHKFIETDGGCVYYHSLPNNPPPGLTGEEEKLDYYACMCVKPTIQEAKMYAYKYQRYPESHQPYGTAKTQQMKVPGPAVDGGQELIQEGHSPSSSIGVGTTDELYALHEEPVPNGGKVTSPNITTSPLQSADLPSTEPLVIPQNNGVVLRRGRGWGRQFSGNHSSETDSQEERTRCSPRGSSDNLSGGSSGSSSDDRKPLKSCLRRHKTTERRCRSMSLSDPFKLYEGFEMPGQKRGAGHRHSYACDGYPLCMDYIYENMDSSQFADMMEWYRATYMPEDVPVPVHQCSCSPAVLPVPVHVPVIQDSLVLPEKPKSTTAVLESNGNIFTSVETPGESHTDDSMDKREKRKSVSFASEVSFHSPLPSPQCSPKRQPNSTPGVPQGAVGNQPAGSQHLEVQGQPLTRQVVKTWNSTNPPQGVPVPSVQLNNGTSDDDLHDSGSDAPPSEFRVLSPRGTTDSQASDSLTSCMDTKRVYLSDVSKAAECLVKHFSKSREPFDKLRLGSSVDTPEVGHLVVSQLCPAVARVISDGLKPYLSGLHVFGRIQVTVWRVAEVSAELGPSTRAIHELVKDLRNRMDLVSTRQKFEAFVFGLLNLRLLDFWMGYTRHKDKVVGRLYEADSILCMSATSLQRAYDEMLVSLQPLAILPFQLDYGFLVSYHAGRMVSPMPSLELQSASEDFGQDRKGRSGVPTSLSHDVLVHGTRTATSAKEGSPESDMRQSQPTSNKSSWSWLSGSYMSNTLPRAKSMMVKLQQGAVRGLARLGNSPSAVLGMPPSGSHDSLEQCLPRNKGELFQRGHNSSSVDSSRSVGSEEHESSNQLGGQHHGTMAQETPFSLHEPQFEGSDHSSQSDRPGMTKFASKIFNIAAGNRQKPASVYRRGVTEYYFEGDSDISDSLQSAKTLTGSSDSSGLKESDSAGQVRTWKEVKESSSSVMPVPPPKPPRSLHMQRLASASSFSSAASTSVSSNSSTSPSKSKTSFDLIKLFDKLLLPNEAPPQPKKPARWSWTPLSTSESLCPSIDPEHYRSVTTFKTDTSEGCQEMCSRTHDSDRPLVSLRNETLNQIQLSDGPILTLPPPCSSVAKNSPQKPCSALSNSGCYSGIVQSENLSLTVSSELPGDRCTHSVDGNANFVTRPNVCSDRPPVWSRSAVSRNDQQSSGSGQSSTPAQSTNHQCSSSHDPQHSSNQAHRMVQGDSSSSDTDQSKSSSSDQSEMAEPSGSANKIPAETLKLPDFRFWHMYRSTAV